MTRPTTDADDLSVHRDGGDQREMVLSEERMDVSTVTEEVGRARAVKHVDVETVTSRVERGTEHADMERLSVVDAELDSGQVETLADGSLSIPVFEEQIVVTKRLVVRERVVIRKHTVFEEHVVTADLRKERLEVIAEGDVVVEDDARHGTDDLGTTGAATPRATDGTDSHLTGERQ